MTSAKDSPSLDNPRLWQIMAAHRAPPHPPYPDDMQVTPLSTFGATTWAYPLSWASLNNRWRLTRNHLASARFGDKSAGSLLIEADAVLLQQLKEACWASTHRADLLCDNRTPSLPKPLTEHGIHRLLRRLLVAFKRLGCSTLADVQQAEFDEAMRVLAPRPAELLDLASTFHGLIQFSKHGLIIDGIRDLGFEVTAPPAITDVSGIQGLQPLSDDESSKLIRISLAYLELAKSIAEKIKVLRLHPESAPEVLDWARSLPCGASLQLPSLLQSLTFLVHVPAANLIAFHLGLRVSELLSIRQGFVSQADGEATLDIKRLTVEFTRYKTIRSYFGEKTSLGVHPEIIRVAEALEDVREALGNGGDHLFVPAGDALPYVTNSWNYYLQRFCDLHSLDIKLTSHRWRETVAATAVRVLTGSALYVKELYGHAGFAMAARYMFASPFIRDEIQDQLLDEYRKRGKSLLDSLTVFGGPGLGGRQGKEWEAQFRRVSLDRDITEQDLRQTQEEFLDEMLRQGVFPRPVMPGVFCVAQITARGECSRNSRDRSPDFARCSARCPMQVQEANRRATIVSNARKFAAARTSRSPLEQRYWAAQIADQLMAWPELEEELQDLIENWPQLKQALNE